MTSAAISISRYLMMVALLVGPDSMAGIAYAQGSSTTALALTATPNTVRPGEVVQYAVTVTNRASSRAFYTVNALVPSHTTVASSAISGDGACGFNTSCVAGTAIRWSYVEIAAGQSATVTFAARVNTTSVPAAGTLISSTASANGGGSGAAAAVDVMVGTAPPSMSFDRMSLRFGAVTMGAAFTSRTSAQTVRLTQTGTGRVTWTAVPSVPWLVVTPTSGSGSTTLTISTQFAAGLTASQTGSVNLTLTGAGNTVGPITVTLTTVPTTAAPSPPFGNFDTPAGDATVLAGSIALTGWTLDNIGVKQVELWRDRQVGETTQPGNSTPGDPRNGKIFISNAAFVDNARPDVEGLNPTIPANYRAGWGYLMLTWGLFGQGNGSYNFYAFGVDQEGNTSTIGTKTVIISNNTATKPFGSIDTPAIGGEASGPNFGWGLTPKVNGTATCKIQASGVQYSIDSGPLQPVVYGGARADIAGAFPGFSNTAAAGGHALIDWTALTNGSHTIVWLITDDCNRADGVGSRFFNVTSGTSLRAADAESMGAVPGSVFALRASETESDTAITVARGYGELPQIVPPDTAGSRTIEMRQGERIEVRVPRGILSAYQLGPTGQRRALPVGSTWDQGSGTFYWQPAPGFLGGFRVAFSNGTERISVRIIVVP